MRLARSSHLVADGPVMAFASSTVMCGWAAMTCRGGDDAGCARRPVAGVQHVAVLEEADRRVWHRILPEGPVAVAAVPPGPLRAGQRGRANP
jgi:hypothetical protein